MTEPTAERSHYSAIVVLAGAIVVPVVTAIGAAIGYHLAAYFGLPIGGSNSLGIVGAGAGMIGAVVATVLIGLHVEEMKDKP